VSAERDPLTHHREERERFAQLAAAEDRVVGRFSIAQLVLFGGSIVLAGSGLYSIRSGGTQAQVMLLAGLLAFVLFLIVRGVQGRALGRREQANTRSDIHDRHVKRLMGSWRELGRLDGLLPPYHPYASDLDIVGDGSLVQRIDTTHTMAGARSLAAWLGRPADEETIAARQAAVAELAPKVELRQELEAAVLDTGRERLDAAPFVELMSHRGLLEEKPWLAFVAPTLPILTVGLLGAGYFDLLPWWLFVFPLAVQIWIVRMTEPRSREVYGAMGSKKGFVDAYTRLFRQAETMKVEAPLLAELKKKLEIGESTPSSLMKRLDRWVAWYELRESGIVHVFVNPLLLWDLNCLVGIERWVREVGRKSGAWFEVLGEIEALAALSVLLHHDPSARMPEIADKDEPFEAEQIVHPLLLPSERVANDVELSGPGSCAIVTGSNMAGKSTLLRAIGVNIALALAGGPILARRMRVPRVRVRASMRIADSLQSHASYFQAELQRLRIVVDEAEAEPPIFFLLDELLRGTNAKARHIGARAVVKHLLDRGAVGLVATHDVALSELERERPGKVINVHFTDVIEHGQMIFDYRLRPGVVRTSNALRLLQQVGIEVEDDPVLLAPESPAPSGVESPAQPADGE
jgi:hypothetical protein